MGRDQRLNPFNALQNREPIVKDAFNRTLQERDLVMLRDVTAAPYMITKIAPILEPGAPPGMMMVEVRQRLRFMAPREVPQKEFVRVLTKTEGQAFETVPSEPDEDEPPPPPPDPPPSPALPFEEEVG